MDDFLEADAGAGPEDGTASARAFPFDNSYARLPERFYARLDPTPVQAPSLIKVNTELAAELGLDPDLLASPEGVEMLAGNRTPPGSEPIAMAYAGFQFGGWVPQLGDGRAILLGEVIDRNGKRRDIQLKGSGRTPFSRMGDGRAPLGPVLREYIVSEAMTALGVPTSRSLAAVATGEPVARESVEPGAVLTRIAASHIRVGTFQFFAARKDEEALKVLADHVIERHHGEAAQADDPYLALLEAVMDAQAALVARWMGIGFIHGVMNTDNMTVSGETIDYGPCAYMDIYHPDTVYSSIDHYGRYAYSNQPKIAHWNLVCLAQALLPLLKGGEEEAAVEAAQELMNTFPERYRASWLEVMRQKLGLASGQEGDEALINDLLSRMAENKVDFTLLFRRLAGALDEGGDSEAARELFADRDAFDAWAVQWRGRLEGEDVKPDKRREAMLAANPLYIPRNHLVEEAIAAALKGDLRPFEELNAVLSKPFEEQEGRERFTLPPRPEEVVQATFCGT